MESNLKNRPIITITGRSPAPGGDARAYERFKEWRIEVWDPVNIRNPAVLGIDDYGIVRENPEYPSIGGIFHYQDLNGWRAAFSRRESAIIQNEARSWDERGITEVIWSAAYALLKRFRGMQALSTDSQDNIERAQVMHLEAYHLSQEEQDKYAKWFNEHGYPIFMSLLMKLPGIDGYDWYEDTGLRPRQAREVDYPKYLSIVYFENMNAYEGFVRSPELAGFQKALRSVFPRGLNYKWYVQYQLVKSWRK